MNGVVKVLGEGALALVGALGGAYFLDQFKDDGVELIKNRKKSSDEIVVTDVVDVVTEEGKDQ